MVRTVLLAPLVAGFAFVVACGGAGEETAAPAADSAGVALAPPQHGRVPLECVRGNRGLEGTVVAVGDAGKTIRLPNAKHELEVAAGVAAPGKEILYVMHEVEGANTDCQVAVAVLTGTPQSITGVPYKLRLACRNLPMGMPCSTDDVLRLDDDSLIQDGTVLGAGANTMIEFELQSLSTYALAAPGGPGGE